VAREFLFLFGRLLAIQVLCRALIVVLFSRVKKALDCAVRRTSTQRVLEGFLRRLVLCCLWRRLWCKGLSKGWWRQEDADEDQNPATPNLDALCG
jgi:hypothetical protein